MTPPWFVRFLPQREAAFKAMRAFSIEHNDGEVVEPSETRIAERTVQLIAATFEGREYSIGYEWTDEQVRRYLPARPPEPNFYGGAAWPADVLVPPREIRR